MEPVLWDRVQELYHSALPVVPSERGEFVARICGSDPFLIQEVTSLLEADDSSADFLKSPVFEVGLKIITSNNPDHSEDSRASSQLIGVTIDGRYLVEKEIGHGGMGTVYLARDRRLHNKRTVVKVLLEKSLQNERVVQKFQQEKEALARVDHHGVVNILDAGELPDGTPFIVMQYIEGISLREAIAAEPDGMDFERASRIIRGIGAALSAVHDKKIFHRDLKPENIMLQRLGPGEEQVKVLDFGIAKVKESLVAPSTLTGAGVLGTVLYMSPEQLRGDTVTSASDIYSFAIVSYEMVTGRRPFNPDTIGHLAEMQRQGVRAKPADLRPRLPDEAQAIILNGLAFAPEARLVDAREFGNKLSRALVNVEVVVRAEAAANSFNPPNAASTIVSGAAPIPQSLTVPDALRPSSPFAPGPSAGGRAGINQKKRLVLAVVVIFLIASAVATYWIMYPRDLLFDKEANTHSSATSPHRSLSYSLTVQKMRDGLPYKEPFESSGQEIFENGYRFQLNVTSRQAGYLYVFNEGAEEKDKTGFTIVYPTPETNQGSARLGQNQDLQTNWNTFGGETGTERFWIVWSATAVTPLEIARYEAFKNKEGALTDSSVVKDLRDFLVQHSDPQPETTKDTARQRTTVRANGDLLVKLVELEHR
jgi:tRNA A-37 threonylcarbamoyl transferase component Bud32